MFRMRRCSPTFLKLTTICDVSSRDKFYQAFLSLTPLFFPTREEGLALPHKRGRPGYEAKLSMDYRSEACRAKCPCLSRKHCGCFKIATNNIHFSKSHEMILITPGIPLGKSLVGCPS